MTQFPTPTEHSAAVARLAVPTFLAAVSAMLPSCAPVIALATPLAVSVTEYAIERPTRLLMDALRRGELVDLSDQQAAALVPMAYRFYLTARQGEFEHNLKLLAAFLTDELKSQTCEPGSFVDMARRVEGLTATSLKAVAMIGEWLERPREPDPREGGKAVTAPLLNNSAKFKALMPIEAAADALADLTGRGLLFSVGSGYGGGQFYSPTGPFRALTARALDIAEAATCDRSQMGDRAG